MPLVLRPREQASQYLFLMQQIWLRERPLIHVSPRVVVQFRGRAVLVSCDLNRLGPSLTPQTLPELQIALACVCESVNLSPYYVLLDDGTERECYGPSNVTAKLCPDGRYYLDACSPMFPYLPPMRGTTPTPRTHLIRLSLEWVRKYHAAISPASFTVFGSRDSAQHSINTRQCAAMLCHYIIPEIASQLKNDMTIVDIISMLKAAGGNVGLLAVLYINTPSDAIRRTILTEMAARAARHVVRAAMMTCIDVDELHSAASAFCATFCDAEHRATTWNDVLKPCIAKKFPGFGVLVQPAPEASDIDLELWLERFRCLMAFNFAPGVTSKGTSAFHFSIDVMLPSTKRIPIPPFFVGPLKVMTAAEAATLDTNAIPPTVIARYKPCLCKLLLMSELGSHDIASEYVRYREHHPGKSSPIYAHALYEVGAVLRKRKDYDKGLLFLNMAISALEQQHTAQAGSAGDGLLMSLILTEKGLVSCDLGTFHDAVRDLNRANTYFQNMTNKKSSIYPKTESTVGESGENEAAKCAVASAWAFPSLAALAQLYEDKGLTEEAEPIYRLILDTTRSLYGENDIAVSNALNNLAVNLFNQEMYREAQELYEEDLRISEALLGPDDIAVAFTLNNLACLYDRLDEFDKSEPMYQRDIEITMKVRGENHADVATSRNNLAASYAKQRRFPEAEEQYAKALKIRMESFGEKHFSVAETLNNIAALQKAQGKLHEAHDSWTKALAGFEAAFGKNHFRLRQCLENLLQLAEEMGNTDEMEALGDRLMDLKRADNDVYTAQQQAVSQSK